MQANSKMNLQTTAKILQSTGKQQHIIESEKTLRIIGNTTNQPQIIIEELEQQESGNSSQKQIKNQMNSLEQELDPKKWTDQEQRALFKLNKQYGNKWAKIASIMGIPNDNCIKNHFYCTLRRGMKFVDRFISHPNNRKKYKPIKLCVLMKLFTILQDKLDNKLGVSSQIFIVCDSIKNRLVNISNGWLNQQDDKIQIQNVIEELLAFNLSYKRKKRSKRFHRGSIISPRKSHKATKVFKDNSSFQSNLQKQNNQQIKVKQQNPQHLLLKSFQNEPIFGKTQKTQTWNSNGVKSQVRQNIILNQISYKNLNFQGMNSNIYLNNNVPSFDPNNNPTSYPSYPNYNSQNQIVQRCKFLHDQLMLQSYSNLLLCNQLAQIISQCSLYKAQQSLNDKNLKQQKKQ